MSYMYTLYTRPASSLAANEDAEFWTRAAPGPHFQSLETLAENLGFTDQVPSQSVVENMLK